MAHVGAHEHAIGQLQALEPLAQHRAGVEVIDGDVEETLHLRGVQVDGHHAVGPAAFDQVRDQLGRDRRAALVLAVLPGVAEVRHHDRHASGAGPAKAVDPDEQFHQVRVDGVARGLEHVAVTAADVFVDFADQFAVGEQVGLPVAEGNAQVPADSPGQVGVGPAGEDLDFGRVERERHG